MMSSQQNDASCFIWHCWKRVIQIIYLFDTIFCSTSIQALEQMPKFEKKYKSQVSKPKKGNK